MPLQTCPKCGRFHYVPGDCPPPFKSKPTDPVEPIVVAKAAPDGKVTKKKAVQQKRGRPATGFDKTAYQRELMRKRRAKGKP